MFGQNFKFWHKILLPKETLGKTDMKKNHAMNTK